MPYTALFRTKSGHKQGMGDITGSCQIAGEFEKNGFKIIFLIDKGDISLEYVKKNKIKYFAVETNDEIEKAVKKIKPHITVLNQLKTTIEEGLLLKNLSNFMVTIDDDGEVSRLADLRFNVLYPIPDSICDLSFIGLSERFQEYNKLRKEVPEDVFNIILLQGGSDTLGFLPDIIESLNDIDSEVKISAVIGPAFSHFDKLNKAIKSINREIAIIENLDNLSSLMFSADLAVSAAGNSLFELICVGVPTVVVCGEDFEEITANRLERLGLIENMGFNMKLEKTKLKDSVVSLMLDRPKRAELSAKGRNLIDGKGSHRIAKTIIDGFRA